MTLREKAYESIRGWIVSGRLPEGSVTSEHTLTAQLDMSRTPVRAALQHLETEGFLRIVPKHGILILHASAQRVSDLLETLVALLLFAYEQNKRLKSAEIADITDRFMIAATGNDAPDELAVLEREMWLQIVSLGQNKELIRLFHTTIGKSRWESNFRRWKTPYKTETEQCLQRLLYAMVHPNGSEEPGFFAYLFVLKKTWL